jgi:hypothetical protein
MNHLHHHTVRVVGMVNRPVGLQSDDLRPLATRMSEGVDAVALIDVLGAARLSADADLLVIRSNDGPVHLISVRRALQGAVLAVGRHGRAHRPLLLLPGGHADDPALCFAADVIEATTFAAIVGRRAE